MAKKHKNSFVLEDGLMAGVLLLSLFLRLGLYSMHSPLWDGSVYILMGKSLFSQGAVGLWEPYRPLLWPAMLGFFWKLGGDPIFWGKTLQILFSLGSIYIVYLIGTQVFNKRVGVLAAAFLSFSPTYFTWANYLYTGIPSTFLGLLSVYLMLRRKYFLSGIFSGFAFLARFLQFLLFIPLFFISLARCRERGALFRLFVFIAGFVSIFAVFFISNLVMYGDAFFPFATASKVLGAYSGLWYHGGLFYLQQLLLKENFCLIFYLVGIFLILAKGRSLDRLLIVLLGLLFILSINTSRMQILRYVISALPYMYLVSAYGIFSLYDRLKKNLLVARLLLAIILLSLVVFEYHQFKEMEFPVKKLNPFQKYVQANAPSIKGEIWISNPTVLVYSDLKASQLIYYPVFNLEKGLELEESLDKAGLILFSSADFPCAPQGDSACLAQKNKLITKISRDLKSEGQATGPKGEILAGIFKR